MNGRGCGRKRIPPASTDEENESENQGLFDHSIITGSARENCRFRRVLLYNVADEFTLHNIR